MFKIPHATNLRRISTFQWWRLFFIQDRSGRILVHWLIHLVRIGSLVLTQNLFDKCLDLRKFKIMFVQFLLDIITTLL